MDKNTKKYILIFIIFTLVYLIIDYLNLPTLLNIYIDNINSNLLDIFINSIIVIILYLITYLTIDKRTIEKSKNKKDVYKQILINMYSECIQTLNLIHDENILNKIIKQVDGNAPIIENKIVNNLMNLPFENKDTILDFAKSGEIDVNKIGRAHV